MITKKQTQQNIDRINQLVESYLIILEDAGGSGDIQPHNLSWALRCSPTDAKNLIEIAIHEQLIELDTSNRNTAKITGKGRKVMLAGGWLIYLKQEKTKESRSNRRANISIVIACLAAGFTGFNALVNYYKNDSAKIEAIKEKSETLRDNVETLNNTISKQSISMDKMKHDIDSLSRRINSKTKKLRRTS